MTHAPELFLTVWSGPPRAASAVPESVYSLDKDGLRQMTAADGTPVAFRLAPGQRVDLPDDSSVTFTDWRRWVKLQVSSEPGLALAAAAIAGIAASLHVRPLRLWVRVSDAAGGSRVEVGGLDRAESSDSLADAVAELAIACGVPGDTAADHPPAATAGT